MRIRSAIFNAGFWLWIGVLGIVLPIALIYRPFSHTVARAWARGSLWMLRVLCGITHEVRGRENIPKGAVLIASKHQSAWDTVVLWILLRDPSFVLKRELIFFPIFGWYLMLLECIYIDRKAGAKAMKTMLRKAQELAKKNRPIVIFPEGTRIAPGEKSVYHPGVAALYNHLKLPAVPVAVNSGLLWKRNAFVKTPGKIIIEFLPPIAPGLKGRDFLVTLQERIDSKSAELAKFDVADLKGILPKPKRTASLDDIENAIRKHHEKL